MKDPFLKRLASGPVLADGAMGTQLYARGISFSHCFDELNISNPEIISEIHRDYIASGSKLIETNSFGGNYLRLAAGTNAAGSTVLWCQLNSLPDPWGGGVKVLLPSCGFATILYCFGHY